MLRLNKLTDYAIVILVQMARDPAVRYNTPALASATGLTETTVAKILKDLGKRDIVQSTRGAAGGYVLAQTSKCITVRHVIEAIEGPIAIADCVEGSTGSCLALHCTVRGNWDKVNEAIIEALDAVTLHDMVLSAPMRVYDIQPNDGIAADADTACDAEMKQDGNMSASTC